MAITRFFFYAALKYVINEFCYNNIQAQIKSKPNILGKKLALSDLFYLHTMSIINMLTKRCKSQHMHLIIFMVEVWTISSLCVLFFLLWAWPYLFHHDRVCGFAVSEDCGGDVLLSLLHLSPNHNLTRPFNQLLDSTNKDNKTREYINTN